jgi:opacity protein-like surface antigen
MQRWIVTLALLTTAAGVAYADEVKGLYVGAGVGQFNVEIQDVGLSGEDFDSDDTAFRVFGGWRMNPNFAFELAYIDFGAPSEDVSGVDVDIEVTGFAPYLVLTAPVGVLELYTKLGYLFYDAELSASAGGLSASEDTSDEEFVYALGLGLVFFDRLNVRLEYEGIDIQNAEDATAYWLSGAWRF